MSRTVTAMPVRSRPAFGNKTEVLADLEHRILSGGFPVGTRLPSERDLCQQYDVSRPVLREVLRGLEERGYIETHPGRGSFVRELTGQDLAEPLARIAVQNGVTPRHLVAARLVLETAAASAAATGRTDEQLETIRASLERHDAARTAVEQARTDVAFHESIVAAAANPVIAIMYASIRELVFGMTLRSHTDRRVRSAGDPLHSVILDRIAAGDGPGAAEAMRRHVDLALDLYGADLDTDLDEILAARGLLASSDSGLLGGGSGR